MDEGLAHVLVGAVEVDAEHEAATAYVGDVVPGCAVSGCGAGQRAELLHEVVAHLAGVLHQAFFFKHIEHGQCGGAGQMVAAEGGAQLPIDGLELGTYQYASHREAVGDALGHGDDVGTYVEPLVGEELSRAPVATLYLVAYQYRVVLSAELLQPAGKLFGCQLDAADALYALEDDGTHVALLQLALPCRQVVYWQVGYVAIIVDGGYNLGVVGGLDGQRCTAMEGFLERQHTGAAIAERCQLEGVFVGLGTAVDEEQLVVVVAADASQPAGQLGLQRVDHGVGVEPDALQLLRHPLDVVRMRVSYRDDSVPAVEVEVLLTLVVPDFTALSFHDVHVEQGIYIK